MANNAPDDALPPFGSQSMQTVMDRLHFQSSGLFNNFVTSPRMLRHGVFVTAGRNFSDASHKSFMRHKLMGVADRSGDISHLAHVSFDRPPTGSSRVKGGARPRNGKIFASRERISKFLAMVSELDPGRKFAQSLELNSTAYYWEYFHPHQQLYVHPYFDIDIKVKAADEVKFDDVYSPVDTARRLMTDALVAGCDRDNLETMVLYCSRPVKGDPATIKHSFHLHWPGVIIDSMSQLAVLVRQVNARAPKQPNGTDLLDTSPYGSNQLLRGPFCGKYGEGRAAELRPIRIASLVTGDTNAFVSVPDTTTPRWEVISKACIATPFDPDHSDFIRIIIDAVPRVLARALQQNVVQPTEENHREYGKWMNFWMPVLKRFVVPNFIKFRQQLALNSRVVATFPDIDKPIFTGMDVRRVRGYPASFRIAIEGDTYCEYDEGATPHIHNFADNAVSYVVDLEKGRVYQQCTKCRPVGGDIKWYHFIKYDDLNFEIMPTDLAEAEQTDFVTTSKAGTRHIAFFMRFFYEKIVYARDIKQVMAYDETSGTWKGGLDGNGLVLQLIHGLNDAYRAYAEARNKYICDKTYNQWERNTQTADDDEKETMKKKCLDECRKHNRSIGSIWYLNAQTRQTLLKALQPEMHPHQVDRMEPHAHLVPLAGAQCLDVYTWHRRALCPSDYFVSCLNADILNIADDEVVDFTDWQRQVCCGDEEYLTYKLRIMGLSLTMFNFDRAFYMPLGPCGRNGKSSESFLFNETTMKITPQRGYNISREYLTKQGQSRKGANAADTVMMDLANKTIIIAEECPDSQLDGALIKTLVSGDRTSGRNLYESERSNVENRGKLWIIANKTLKIDYTDKALMDRLRILPYNARWVPNPAAIKRKMNDLTQSMWVFPDDPYFKQKKLCNWPSAMATKCLYELHLFLKSLPRDPEDPTGTRPAKLQTIPVPDTIKTFTKEKIEKEHPVLSFISTYMKQTDVEGDFVSVESTFAQFMRFGKNENSSKIKHMPRSTFQEAMLKEDIDVTRDADGVNHFNGWRMAKDVPNLDKDEAGVSDGAFYIPPAVQGAPKRIRIGDEGYGEH